MALDIESLALAVCDVARKAGAFIKQERAVFSPDKIERKHAHDYVSYVDKGSENIIVESLRRLLPEAGFITEEGTAAYAHEKYCWVVDPLDGTTNFLHSYAPYAVSIALTEGEDILIGVVYEVCADECFYAWRGGGAYVNGKPIHVSNQPFADALLCLQLPYNSDAYKPVIQRLVSELYGRVASVRMTGSAAMALCYVAAGRLDGYAEKYIGQWDYMAGALLVAEAGGCVTDYDGNHSFTRGNSVLATNGAIQQNILEVLKGSCKS